MAGVAASSGHRCVAGRVVIAFVQAQVFFHANRSPHDNRFERGSEKLGVVAVRAGDHDGERTATGLDQNAALYAPFGPVSGVGSDLVPTEAGFPIAASTACHSKSTPPSCSHSFTKIAQTFENTSRRTQR